ncbi:MAG: type II secretion system F family protein [bacterium]|nr:type II secretion system F family protein [bacterium]
MAAAIRSGASIPRALETVGSSAESPALTRAGRLLLLGAGWEEAWRGSEMDSAARLVSRALEPSWLGGVDPVPLLERAAATWQARRDRRAREAAARLGVRLVLPLGLCYLPAFLMVSVLPVMLASGTQILMP